MIGNNLKLRTIRELSEQTGSGAMKIADATTELSQLAIQLNEEVSLFRV